MKVMPRCEVALHVLLGHKDGRLDLRSVMLKWFVSISMESYR